MNLPSGQGGTYAPEANEDDEDEEYDIPDEIEDIIGEYPIVKQQHLAQMQVPLGK